MSKRITEVVVRDCCQPQDLVPVLADEQHTFAQYKRCEYCMQLYAYCKYTDAAGDTDWDYRKIDG